MKSKLIKMITVMIITCSAGYSHAINSFKSADAKITFQVRDTALFKYPCRFSIIEDYIHLNIGATTTDVKANKRGEYIFSVKDLNAKRILIISFDVAPITIYSYIEPGDDITIVCNKLTKPLNGKNYELSYFGKGSQKLAAGAGLRSAEPTNLISQRNMTVLTKSLIDTLVQNADSTYAFKLRLLNRFKDKLNPQIFNKMQADLYGNAYGAVYSYLRTTFTDSNHRDILQAFYDEYEHKLRLNIKENWNSYSYLKFLADKAMAKYQLHAGDQRKRFKAVYDLIVSENSGMTREKLLLFYLLNPSSASASDDPNSVYLNALHYIKTPKYSTYISDLAKAVKKGALAYNFKLTDENGNTRTLSEFSGKLVLLDCWFTGCSSCAALAKTVDKEVLPHYKDNQDIVFISVNVDKTIQEWLKGLKSGMYTNANSINLFTDGKALEHPFIKKYNFQGFPQLLLIDKAGKIFEANMPRNGEKICTIIEAALNSTSNSR